VWEDDRYSNWDIYGTRVDQLGNVLDPIAIAISSGGSHHYPTVAFGDTSYLVVWHRFGPKPGPWVVGALVDTSGAVTYMTEFLPVGNIHRSIAFDGTNYLVVASYYSWRPGGCGISAIRVNQSGLVLDFFNIIDSGPNSYGHNHPSVAFDGTNYLVVWSDARNGLDFDIYGARVDTSGTVLDTAVTAISTATDNQIYPSIAFDGTNYLVVWEDDRYGDWDIYGARVDQASNVLDTMGIVISTAPDSQLDPSVAFDGTNYLVIWEDYRSGSEYDIYGAKLNTSGVVIDSFPVSLQSGDQVTPALAHGTGNQLLITYSGWTDSINGQPVNTMRIWGKFYPFVGIEEGETDVVIQNDFTTTIFSGPLQLPKGKECKVFDITGRAVQPHRIQPGIYFIEIDGVVTQKVVKVR
jgi:hypothetical protein